MRERERERNTIAVNKINKSCKISNNLAVYPNPKNLSNLSTGHPNNEKKQFLGKHIVYSDQCLSAGHPIINKIEAKSSLQHSIPWSFYFVLVV